MARKTILAIDDSITQLKIFETFLGVHYDFSLIKSAAEAFKALEKKDFDLILLDIEMPDISGFEFFHEIRKIPKLMTTPVIIISSFAKDFPRSKCAGAFAVLAKPIDSGQLLETIEKALAAPAKKPFDV